jgi:hypothetical protein
MKKFPPNVFNQIEIVAKHVIGNLKRRGHVLPTQQKDGSFKYENFVVKKGRTGFYSISCRNIVYVDNINLPQTAAVVANGLALGNIINNDIIKLDRDYGYRLFDEELYAAAIKRKKITLDQEALYETRSYIAKIQKDAIKEKILKSFKKLVSVA